MAAHLIFSVPFSADLNRSEVIGCEKWDGGTICVAHDDLAGWYYADLPVGDEVRIVFEDGSMKTFIVVEHGRYRFVETPPLDAVYWDGTMQVDGRQITRSEMILMYSAAGSITLLTCWRFNGNVIGSVILRISEKSDIRHVDRQ